MTVEDIQKRIAAIDDVKGDFAMALAAEDELLKDVLRYIAGNKGHAGPLHKPCAGDRRLEAAEG